MTAGFTETDGVILHRKSAWHNLGIVVQGDAPTPRDGLRQIGAEWGVDQRPLFTLNASGEQVPLNTHVANYRADNGYLLGVVSNTYQPIQNVEVADFCEVLADESAGQVRCESIGTIYGGKKIWFLLKGELFSVGPSDEVYPYILISNGHDGDTVFRVTPTTIRVVCRNTLGMAVPAENDTGALAKSAIAIRHTGSIMERVEEARKALRHYGEVLEQNKSVINSLVAKDVSREDVERFFLESYTADFGDIPANTKTAVEENRRDRAMSAYGSFSKRFDDERAIAGANYWNAFNAYSGLIQHDKKARGKDDITRVTKRVDSNLFGLNQTRTMDAFDRAYRAAVVC